MAQEFHWNRMHLWSQKGTFKPTLGLGACWSRQRIFLLSPTKSTRRASRELKVLQSMVNKILRKRLRLHPYRLQLVQKLHPEDETRHAFCGNLQELMENDDKDHFQWWGDIPLKWKGQQVQCEDIGKWKSACHSGGRTWLSKTQCVLCHI